MKMLGIFCAARTEWLWNAVLVSDSRKCLGRREGEPRSHLAPRNNIMARRKTYPGVHDDNVKKLLVSSGNLFEVLVVRDENPRCF